MPVLITANPSFQIGTSESIDLWEYVPADLRSLLHTTDHQKAVPQIARSPDLATQSEQMVREVPTVHYGVLGDSRTVAAYPKEEVDLILTSPPYWNLKPYEGSDGQLGLISDFDDFLTQLDRIWVQCFDALKPGGRLVIVTGDVLVPRRLHGRHAVFPLHAAIQERARIIGFDNLAPIIWHKIGNANLEAEGNGRFLGKPYEPNAIIKNDIEYILFQRKPGGYRSPSMPARLLSVIPASLHAQWFRQVWELGGTSTRNHPAPFPLELAERLIRMFSFAGDTILDPFLGSGTTSLAAGKWGRNSIGIELEPKYLTYSETRLREALGQGRFRMNGQ